eukprot:Em0018g500a
MVVWLCRKALYLWSKEIRPVLPWKLYLRHVVPVAVFSILDIGLSNWSLIFISVSLYTMSKSSALIFVFLFSVILKLEKPRVVMVLVVLFIVAGLFMFTYHSTKFAVEGFLLVMIASAISGLRWTTAQLTLQRVDLKLSNPIDMLYHLLPVMALTLLPLALTIDGVHIGTSELVFRASNSNVFSVTMVIILGSTVLAFFLNVSEFLLVYHTSGITLSIAGIVKEIIILTLSTMWWEDDTLSTVNIMGMMICVAGITTHTTMKVCDTYGHKKEAGLPQEDHVQLLTQSHQEPAENSESDDDDVVYKTTSA